ncbi:Trypsin-1 like protein [Argiope bruennichi]|uniref:Trypsin-1 like protein n=1 Tax=Argiope bruennichi TaxID=94029 RepID=A0A8T0FLG8_ARGBR|nr:Trypsin-1 like protein [Argiope bruennichi]
MPVKRNYAFLFIKLILVVVAVCGDESVNIANCGISKVSNNGNKIVGGRNAMEGEFPWQLSLQMRPFPIITKFQHICGASILTPNWAVTAAHCIAGGYATSYRVMAGAMNISKRATPTTHLAIPIVHEGYNPMASLKNDIALLRLTTPIDIIGSDGLVNGVCLPPKEMADNVTGMGTVSGWGTTSQGGSLSDQLQAVDVPILTDEKCKEVYKDNYESTMLCAGYEEGGRDSCQGDSGGPFVQKSSDGTSNLIGIVSWGYGCAQPNYPGVYTETAHYLDWIARTMRTVGGGSGISPQ